MADGAVARLVARGTIELSGLTELEQAYCLVPKVGIHVSIITIDFRPSGSDSAGRLAGGIRSATKRGPYGRTDIASGL